MNDGNFHPKFIFNTPYNIPYLYVTPKNVPIYTYHFAFHVFLKKKKKPFYFCSKEENQRDCVSIYKFERDC